MEVGDAFHDRIDCWESLSRWINLHFDNDEQAARDYWSAELRIDPARFTKTFIKPDGTGHRKNHLPCGVCRVTMNRSTDAFITTMAWVDFVRESFKTRIQSGR
jgi:hypothetical protein